MIIAYTLSKDKKLDKVEMNEGDSIPEGTVWLDMFEPTLEEEKTIERELKIDIPTREEMDKIEVLSPFYKEDDAYYMTVTAIHKIDKEYPEGTAIIFILHKDCLLTLRYTRPKAFTYFTSRFMRNPKRYHSPEVILEGLLESLIHSIADVLEKTGNEIDQLLIDVFEKPADIAKYSRNLKTKKKTLFEYEDKVEGNYYTSLIKRVGRTGNLISKIRESLVSINRMFIFFGQIEESQFISKKEHRARFRNLIREIHSITEYANFLSQRNSFLLDATLGMLNVEQNMIIKVFTVAAAVFLPPTLIASIYGMNFIHMPETSWLFGYPFALVLIVLSAILPYHYFKRKGLL